MKASHFIEIYKTRLGITYEGEVTNMIFLDIHLEASQKNHIQTIAIWKIKFK